MQDAKETMYTIEQSVEEANKAMQQVELTEEEREFLISRIQDEYPGAEIVDYSSVGTGLLTAYIVTNGMRYAFDKKSGAIISSKPWHGTMRPNQYRPSTSLSAPRTTPRPIRVR